MFIPCEKAVKDYLPAIRAVAAARLVRKHGFTQAKAASALGITQAAVSKYLSQDPLKGMKPQVRAVVEEIGGELASEIVNRKEGGLDLGCMCKVCGCGSKDMLVCEINRGRG